MHEQMVKYSYRLRPGFTSYFYVTLGPNIFGAHDLHNDIDRSVIKELE